MENIAKPIKKMRFTSSGRRRRVAPTPADRSPLAVSRSAAPTAVGIAHGLGWLERELALDGTPLMLVEDRPADRSQVREGESVAALWARSRGQATRLVGLTWVDAYQAVLAAPGSSIAEPAQLAGRRLALPRDDEAPVDVRRAAACRALSTATGLAGLFDDDVDYVDVPVRSDCREPYAAELAALLRDEVDAIHVAGAAGVTAAARIGASEVVDLGAQLDPAVRASATTPAALTVDARLLEEQPNLVVRVLATLLRAAAWAQAHGVDATRLVAAETGATREDVVRAHRADWHERLHLDLSAAKLAALRRQCDFLGGRGFLAGDVDIGAWVDPRPLGAARELLAAERTAWL